MDELVVDQCFHQQERSSVPVGSDPEIWYAVACQPDFWDQSDNLVLTTDRAPCAHRTQYLGNRGH